jgi:hypothetical protein
MKLKDIKTINDIIKKIKNHSTASKFIEDIEYEDKKTITEIEFRITKGFIYEILWDICIKFNIIKTFENNIEHLFVKEGSNINNLTNINKDDYKKITSGNIFENYLKSIWWSGKDGGYSDISFRYNDEKNNNIYVISSVKYYEKEKDVSNYNIADLCTIIHKLFKTDENKDNYKVVLFIKNKKDFIDKAKSSNKSSNLILRYIDYNYIFDLTDLEKYYMLLRQLLDQYNYLKNDIDIENFKSEYLKIDKNNLIFKPKFHQKLFINKIIHDISDKRKTDNKDFLIGAIPRTGKTYIMAGLILDYIIKNFKDIYFNFLIITPAPSETISQYKEIFEIYYDFKKNNINFIAIVENNEKYKKNIKSDKHNIFVISIQRLIGEKDEDNIIDIIDLEKNKLKSISEKSISSSSKKSVSDDKKSVSDDKKLDIDDKKSVSDDKKSVSDDKKLDIDDKKSVSDDKKSISDDKKSVSDDKKLDIDDKKSVSDDKKFICKPKERIPVNGECVNDYTYLYKKVNCCYKSIPIKKDDLIKLIKEKKDIPNINKKNKKELEEEYISLYDDFMMFNKKGGAKEPDIKKFFTIDDNKILFDILFLDEAHYCLSTQKSEFIINEITNNYSRIPNELIRIFVTATFNKPIYKYKINNRLYWDLNDINKIKKINIKFNNNKELEAYNDFKTYCKENIIFKDIIDKTLKDNFNITDIDNEDSRLYFKLLLNDYKYYPEPMLLTTIWNNLDKIYKEYELAKDINADFNMDLLFNLDKKNKNKFINEEQLKELFHYYLGVPRKQLKINNEKTIELNYIQQNYYKTNGIIKRIENICNNNCRTLQYNKKISQLWFLPRGINGASIFYICIALLELLKNEFINFFNKTIFIVCLSKSDNKNKQKEIEELHKNVRFIIGTPKYKDSSIKKQINNIEKEIEYDNSYKNIVILTNGRLQLGISLNNVDIVTLFNNDKQGDRLYQMMFRSLTEIIDDNICIENEYCSHKKYGFIVDLNPQRTIILINYIMDNLNINRKTKTISEQQKEIVELFNIDKDFFTGSYEKDSDIKKYTSELFSKMSVDYNIKYNYIKELLKEKNIIDNHFIDKNLNIILLFFSNKNKFKKLLEDRGIDIKKKLKHDDISSNSSSSSSSNSRSRSKKEDILLYEELRLKAIELLSHIINISTILLLCNDTDKNCYLYNNKYSDDIIEDFKNNMIYIKDNDELKDIFIYSINNNLYKDDKDKIIITDDLIFKFIDNIIYKFTIDIE